MNDIGIFGLIDETIASAMDTTTETYDEVIENKCSYIETKFIILSVLSGREDKIERAKVLFNSKL